MATEEPKPVEQPKEETIYNVPSPSGFNVIDSDHLLRVKLPPPEFLVNHLIPQGGLTLLSGNPGCGKSWLMLEIAKCVGIGDPLFIGKEITPESFERFKTKMGKVLYID